MYSFDYDELSRDTVAHCLALEILNTNTNHPDLSSFKEGLKGLLKYPIGREYIGFTVQEG